MPAAFGPGAARSEPILVDAPAGRNSQFSYLAEPSQGTSVLPQEDEVIEVSRRMTQRAEAHRRLRPELGAVVEQVSHDLTQRLRPGLVAGCCL